jgi:hypothetical protein
MKHPRKQVKTISELIGTLDRIREELFIVQRSLEKLEDGGSGESGLSVPLHAEKVKSFRPD